MLTDNGIYVSLTFTITVVATTSSAKGSTVLTSDAFSAEVTLSITTAVTSSRSVLISPNWTTHSVISIHHSGRVIDSRISERVLSTYIGGTTVIQHYSSSKDTAPKTTLGNISID